jgi:hypothetical protein
MRTNKRSRMQVQNQNATNAPPPTRLRRSARLNKTSNAAHASKNTLLYKLEDARGMPEFLGFVVPQTFDEAEAQNLALAGKMIHVDGRLESNVHQSVTTFFNSVQMEVYALTQDPMTGIFNKVVAKCDIAKGVSEVYDESNVILGNLEFEIHVTMSGDTRRYRLLHNQILLKPDPASALMDMISLFKQRNNQSRNESYGSAVGMSIRYTCFWYVLRNFVAADIIKRLRFADLRKVASKMNANNNSFNSFDTSPTDLAFEVFDMLNYDEMTIDIVELKPGVFVPKHSDKVQAAILSSNPQVDANDLEMLIKGINSIKVNNGRSMSTAQSTIILDRIYKSISMHSFDPFDLHYRIIETLQTGGRSRRKK